MEKRDSGLSYFNVLQKAKRIQKYKINEIHQGVLKALSDAFGK